MWRLSERDTARRLGLVPQSEATEWPLTVEQMVALGRAPHRGLVQAVCGCGPRRVDAALEQTGLGPLRGRLLGELSGGERQRVLIARALAQQPATILMDEPTAHLDLRYQGAVLGLARRLAHERGLAVVISLHDLNLVALYADRVALIAGGGLDHRGFARGGADAASTCRQRTAFRLPSAATRCTARRW